ncbi:MAG: glutathione S-transferase family protein [Aestuariivirga sp.]
MITLYGTGPMFGLPHARPFAIKAEVLLKNSGLSYTNARASYSKAPKGKIPYIEEGGRLIPDSTFIRFYLEDKHGIDFTGGYDARMQGIGWALEKLMEDHVYWLNVNDRWLVDENFYKGPVHFFDKVPALLRPIITRMVRRKVRRSSHAHGIGRHSAAERLELGKRAIDATAVILAGNAYILGDRVSGIDASCYGFLLSLMCPLFASQIRDYGETKDNIMQYLERMSAEFFPGLYHAKN